MEVSFVFPKFTYNTPCKLKHCPFSLVSLRIHKVKVYYFVRILNESRLGMGLYPVPFWGKSKNWSRVVSNMFHAEMARSI